MKPVTHKRQLYDGKENRGHGQPGGFLCCRTNPANISFNVSADGVALFKSLRTEIWPLYLVVVNSLSLSGI